jgi:hypothetical protein
MIQKKNIFTPRELEQEGLLARAGEDWGGSTCMFQALYPFLDLRGSPPLSFHDAVREGYRTPEGDCIFSESEYQTARTYGLIKLRNTNQAELLQQGRQLSFLTEDEFLAVFFYTFELHPRSRSLYFLLNKDLTDKNRSLASKWKYFLHFFFSAVRKIAPAPMQQDLYRGVRADVARGNPGKYTPGKTFVEYAVTSTTRTLDVVKGFIASSSSTVFTINSAFSARSISPYSAIEGEEEFLFPPTSYFEVVGVTPFGNVTFIQLKQLPSPENDSFQFEGPPPSLPPPSPSSTPSLPSSSSSSSSSPSVPPVSTPPKTLAPPSIPPPATPSSPLSSSSSSSSSSASPSVPHSLPSDVTPNVTFSQRSSDLTLRGNSLTRHAQSAWDAIAQAPYPSQVNSVLTYKVKVQGGSVFVGWAPATDRFDVPPAKIGYFFQPVGFEGCKTPQVPKYSGKVNWNSIIEVTTVYHRQARTITFSVGSGPTVTAFLNVTGELLPTVSFFGALCGNSLQLLSLTANVVNGPVVSGMNFMKSLPKS